MSRSYRENRGRGDGGCGTEERLGLKKEPVRISVPVGLVCLFVPKVVFPFRRWVVFLPYDFHTDTFKYIQIQQPN